MSTPCHIHSPVVNKNKQTSYTSEDWHNNFTILNSSDIIREVVANFFSFVWGGGGGVLMVLRVEHCTVYSANLNGKSKTAYR